MARGSMASTANYFRCNTAPNLATPPLSIVCWFNLTTLSGTKTICQLGYIPGSGANYNNRVGLGVQFNTGKVSVLSVDNAGSSGEAVSSTAAVINTWYHAAGVWTGIADRKAYLNAGGEGSNTTNLTLAQALDHIIVGQIRQQADASPIQAFPGYVSDLAIYNVALNTVELAELAGGRSPLYVRQDGLVAYWPFIFGDGSGDQADIVNGYKLLEQGTVGTFKEPPNLYSMAVPSKFLLDGKVIRYESNPVVPNGAASSFDESKTGTRAILRLGHNDWRMWYEGVNDDSGIISKIGYATSPDAVNWTKYGSNPIVDHEVAWEGDEVAAKTVLLESGTFKMWYHGGGAPGRQIGYATSSDGIAWTKDGGNPIFTVGAGGQWDDENVCEPCVIKVGSMYFMYYWGFKTATTLGSLGLATSSDGITWTRHPANPVVEVGASGQWDDSNVGMPSVIYANGLFHMWYSGSGSGSPNDDGVGYAYSEDGYRWKKGRNNPVWTPLGTAPETSIGDTITAFMSERHVNIYATGYVPSPRVEAIYHARLDLPRGSMARRQLTGVSR